MPFKVRVEGKQPSICPLELGINYQSRGETFFFRVILKNRRLKEGIIIILVPMTVNRQLQL